MKKTLTLITMLLICLLIFTTFRTENDIDNRTYFSFSIPDNYSRINYSKQISDFSFPPIEDFCSEKNMSYYMERNILGCIDEFGDRHQFNVSYNNDSWTIGDKTYKAIWNQPKTI